MRFDKNKNFKYFTAGDFNLGCKTVKVKNLNGCIYTDPDAEEKREEILVFCHGMGPGHIAYTTEIAYFCRAGYTVLALDARGCNMSKGGVGGMYTGVQAAVTAVDYAKSLSQKVVLVGHSWGGYSALCASYLRKVDKVVAISAPASAVKTLSRNPLAVPVIGLYNFLRFGVHGNINAAKCAAKNQTPTLLVHGERDNIVDDKNAVIYMAEGGHVQKLMCKDKSHNPYASHKAQQMLIELNDKSKDAEYVKAFDFAAATEEDEEVMREIVEFLQLSSRA